MTRVRVLTEAELRAVITMGSDELEAIEAIYPIISSGAASIPPIMRIDVPDSNGEIDIKSAYVPGYPGIAVKVSAGFFDNPAKGLPSLGGLMMVFDSGTGLPSAALFDNGYLTDVRTALAGAVAAKHLSRPDSATVGMIGAGVQARLQLEALMMTRDIESAVVWARRADRATIYATDMSRKLGIDVAVADSVGEAVSSSDIVVTTTPAGQPLVFREMLRPGMHITAVGSDAEHKQELDAAVLSEVDRFVCDSIDQSKRLGELRSAVTAGFDLSRAVELGAIVSGEVRGRETASDVTVCDLTGTGAQDTAIASLAVRRCVESDVGVTFETSPT